MKTNHRRGLAAFTLVELMAVITIIVILAGLVVSGLGYVNERQAKEKARVQIALLSKAMEDYKADMGSYPGDPTKPNTLPAGTAQTQFIYTALFYDGYDYGAKNSPAEWAATRSTKIYLSDLDPTSTKQGWVDVVTGENKVVPSTRTIKDPWGNEYRYRKGSGAMNPDFDLWSMGKDGATNQNDPKAKISQDDVRNF